MYSLLKSLPAVNVTYIRLLLEIQVLTIPKKLHLLKYNTIHRFHSVLLKDIIEISYPPQNKQTNLSSFKFLFFLSQQEIVISEKDKLSQVLFMVELLPLKLADQEPTFQSTQVTLAAVQLFPFQLLSLAFQFR